MTQKKALVLISGGLDSLLAAKIILDQGVWVEGINFFSGFFGEGSNFQNARKKRKSVSHSYGPRWVTDRLGIPLHVVDVLEEFKAVLFHPRYGYGSQLNPCLDCKIFLIRKALEWVKTKRFDFLVTGEVLGQRPMSQRKDTLPLIVKKTGSDDLLLRPLSAKLLEPTLPERMGWVDREKLYDISGRGRKRQIELALQFGFKEIPQPAGGCLLTETCYSRRLRDLWNARGRGDYDWTDIQRLKAGRHIRPRSHFKMIVGRDEVDNQFLDQHKQALPYLICTNSVGPLALIEGEWRDEDAELAASILARYTREGKSGQSVRIVIHFADGSKKELDVLPLKEFQESWCI